MTQLNEFLNRTVELMDKFPTTDGKAAMLRDRFDMLLAQVNAGEIQIPKYKYFPASGYADLLAQQNGYAEDAA